MYGVWTVGLKSNQRYFNFLEQAFKLMLIACIAWWWSEEKALRGTRTSSAPFLTQQAEEMSMWWEALRRSAVWIPGKSYSNKHEVDFGQSIFSLTHYWFGFLTTIEKLEGWKEVFSWENQNGTYGRPGFIQHWIWGWAIAQWTHSFCSLDKGAMKKN